MATLLEFEKPIQEMEDKIAGLRTFSQENGIELSTEIGTLEEKLLVMKKETFHNLSAWDRVRLARHPERPTTLDLVERIFPDFMELKGDRLFSDDEALIGGLASFQGKPVTVLGHQKGRDTKENIQRNFGMPHPEGYRKALRLMEQAEKFKRPIVTFVDTSGAYCGLGAEERGQGQAIALNLYKMARLGTPIVTIVVGEGGSGGALGIGVGDRIGMLESAVYSVISPEGLSSILWKDATQAQRAAEVMKLTARDLKALKVIDTIIEEPLGGAHRDWDTTAASVQMFIAQSMNELNGLPVDQLIESRYQKFRKMGTFQENI